ncbi:dihydrofolate reductase family protein [Streptomyces sp. NPDC006458]|uniref:dihydrofolate reductase family protein n=1 Tax=Streptomyces sp. NPDC006458 TaxID=3154302 RepID=UPI0033ABA05A
MTKWAQLQAWAFPQRFSRENLKLGEGCEEGLDNDIARATYERTGASVMGKRMLDAGEPAWPQEAPFHTPVFVVTHTRRDPWERPGGTTFHFVNDGISSARDRAREAAGDRDVRIAGGADTIQQYLDSGLIDEFTITLAPVLLGTASACSTASTRPPGPPPDPHGHIVPGDPPELHRRKAIASRRTAPVSAPGPGRAARGATRRPRRAPELTPCSSARSASSGGTVAPAPASSASGSAV